MARLLALDAALGPCSVALLDGDGVAAEDRRNGRESLAELPAMVADVLDTAVIDAVAVTVGPGSFTGLRAAIALAQGVALGRSVPVVGVTVAEAMSAGIAVPAGVAFWVALDTRRGRVFLSRDGSVAVVALSALPSPTGAVLVTGDAAHLVAKRLQEQGYAASMAGCGVVSAAGVGLAARRRLAGELPPCPVEPLYVEPPEARVASGLRPRPA